MTDTLTVADILNAPITPAPHPAKFSAPIIDRIESYLAGICPGGGLRILDPFAGVGRVHQLAGPDGLWNYTLAVELEPEWAVQGGPRTVVADAHRLPLPAGSVDAIVTSPCYGNRMADTYDGKGVCRACAGHPLDLEGETCGRCRGTGVDQSTRNTYRIKLGRPLSRNSAAALQWGPAYRRFHVAAWAEALRVLRPGGLFILNASDHMRAGQRQRVVEWHHDVLVGRGLHYIGALDVATRRNRHGANGDKRVAAEVVAIYRQPEAA